MKITPNVLLLKLAMGQVKYQGNVPYSREWHLTCTAWTVSLNIRDDGGDKHTV
jgi:hypothetical protein